MGVSGLLKKFAGKISGKGGGGRQSPPPPLDTLMWAGFDFFFIFQSFLQTMFSSFNTEEFINAAGMLRKRSKHYTNVNVWSLVRVYEVKAHYPLFSNMNTICTGKWALAQVFFNEKKDNLQVNSTFVVLFIYRLKLTYRLSFSKNLGSEHKFF